MKISIIGAGNGGQAMAGHFSMLGHSVKLYNRSIERISPIYETNLISLYGAIEGVGKLDLVTDDLQKAIEGSELIMVVTTANAHKELAQKLAPILEDHQTIVLNPGRTLGAFEFSETIQQITSKEIFVAEAQSLLYACRAESPGKVRIIGIKDHVPIAALPSFESEYVAEKVNSIYPCFHPVDNVLVTSLENIGAILHPSVVLFNAAAIERGSMFYFYNDMTPAIADFISKIDEERLAIGAAYGIQLNSVFDWISYAYEGISGSSLCERMQNNPAYYKIHAPTTLYSRLLTEDIPTGILPLIELAKLAQVEVPLLTSVYELSTALLKNDFKAHGRTLDNLGLPMFSLEALKEVL